MWRADSSDPPRYLSGASLLRRRKFSVSEGLFEYQEHQSLDNSGTSPLAQREHEDFHRCWPALPGIRMLDRVPGDLRIPDFEKMQ